MSVDNLLRQLSDMLYNAGVQDYDSIVEKIDEIIKARIAESKETEE